jgi:hypothetical protein
MILSLWERAALPVDSELVTSPDCLDPMGEKSFGLTERRIVVGLDADDQCGGVGLDGAGAPGEGDDGLVVSSVDVEYLGWAVVPATCSVVTRCTR